MGYTFLLYMNNTPKKLNDEMSSDKFYKVCAREHHGGCGGRITREHALTYAGRQIQEKFAIIPLCERHHGVCQYMDNGDLDKRFNEWVAISRMSLSDMAKYPNVNWTQKLRLLDSVYRNDKNTTIIKRIEDERKRFSNSV